MALLASSAGLLGCSSSEEEPRGQVVVSINADVAAPDDIDEILVEVLAFGSVQHSSPIFVGPSDQKLPATLTVVGGDDPSRAFTVRVVSFKNSQAKTVREVVTTVPEDRTALLPVKVEWLCWDQVEQVGQSVPPVFDTSCPSGQTCVGGNCVSSDLDSESLPDYSDEAVFGGAAVGEDGECFDTIGCFSTGQVVEVDADCTIAEPSGGTGVNVALVRPPGTAGIRGTEASLIPLDKGGAGGWSADGGRIQLPTAVCDRMADDPTLAVAVTTDCATKGVGLPVCGRWSAVPSNVPGDEGAPAGYDPTAPDGGAPAL